jgi:hypothetical protein
MTDPVTLFLAADQRKWIFPLRTPVVFAQTDPKALRDHIALKLLDPKQPDGFVTGQLAYSRKDVHHLRRVLVLDPFATFFLYDFVYTNRKSFAKPARSARRIYGHSFHKGQPVDAFAEYHAFRRKKYELISEHGFFAQLDVFNCFNSFYHHDVTSFVTSRTTNSSGEHFGQFLRELNAGVSVACFPQGLYPAKVLGNAYLSFIEESRKLKARGITRFLDDIVIADPSEREVHDNVLELQYVLDKHHLSLNDSKTIVGKKGRRFQEQKLDRIKRDLLTKRDSKMLEYDGDDDADDSEDGLNERERDYLFSLIREPNVAQEDVELALSMLREEPDALALLVDPVLDKAPHLLRSFHRFLAFAKDPDAALWPALTSRLKSDRAFPEHDLFWYARILIDHFDFDQGTADMLLRIYEHPNASVVVRAAVLETEDLKHGFADLKETALRGEGTLLVAAAGMVGLAKQDKAKRNHTFKYVARHGAHAAALMNIAGKMAV